MIANFCINRPVATTLLAIGLVLAGLAGFSLLPVAALPKVDFPTISVSSSCRAPHRKPWQPRSQRRW